MQITLRQAAEALPALQKLGERELSLQIAWKLAQVTDVIQTQVQLFQKTNQKRAAELDVVAPLPEDADEATRAARIAAVAAFNAEAEELLGTALIDLPDSKFKLADFGEAPIKAAALTGISFLIQE